MAARAAVASGWKNEGKVSTASVSVCYLKPIKVATFFFLLYVIIRK